MKYRFLRFPDGKEKAVTLSYDDGIFQDVRMSEILNTYGLKCTFNLNGEIMPRKRRQLSDDEVKALLAQGHEIAVHGYFHRAEGVVRPIEAIRDVLDCRLELEGKYGIIIRGMAYPDFGVTRFQNPNTYETVKQYLTDLDIAYARTLGGDNDSFRLPEDWHRWMPTAHHNNPQIFEYIEKFFSLSLSEQHNAQRDPRLFYLWGHSFEFDSRNNWDHLERVCEKLSGKEDVWYATNIEIYNYVTAYNSLIYSADATIIYNPTLFEIWFDADGKLYSVKPGETLKLS